MFSAYEIFSLSVSVIFHLPGTFFIFCVIRHLLQLRIRAHDVTPQMHLSSQETAALLSYLRSVPWREDFDYNLQCVSEMDGEPLLTGWMSLEKFRAFLTSCNTHSELRGLPVQAVAVRLRAESKGWKAIGVDDVYFVGHATPEPEQETDCGARGV